MSCLYYFCVVFLSYFNYFFRIVSLLRSNLNFFTSVHLQTDGQTERVNALLETYLRHYVSTLQKDWPKLLDVAQFFYNLQMSETTSQSLFEHMTSQQPHTLSSVGEGYKGPTPIAYKFAKKW